MSKEETNMEETVEYSEIMERSFVDYAINVIVDRAIPDIRDGLKLNPKHRAHDPRKQFISMAKKYNLDEYAIKYIVGHRIYDVTEKVYTDRTVQWLKDEMEKIK